MRRNGCAPILVLLPGMDGTGSLFLPLIDQLGLTFDIRVVRYPATEALGYEALERLVISSLPKGEAFMLLGESFSGPIAISIAAAQPPGLTGLILCSTFAVSPRPAITALWRLAKTVSPRRAPIAVLDYLLLGRYSSKALCSALASAVSQLSPAAFSARMRAIHTVNVLPKLKSISTPVLYLQATEDRLVPSSSCALIQRELPAIRVVSVAAPHCLLQAAPVEAALALRTYAEQL
ncbi:alpha/beta fold hydrolase [Phytopseudomonas punonensis]|uniref:Pimeloyl-ACP methyl ester carboxylesterase n=1 Tax=Phytopseudomonas punonensis TaxID=1220495 RepID=A0A1M7K8Z3_9GAMM|nr:alpha/beta hydrolase [Pseudomonas punonensis]SHM61726.1 Pimeloyl-ACP methyl ester carboxylesterase [Pseudomonas punonensis]